MFKEYYGISAERLGTDSKIPLIKFDSSEAVFIKMASEMIETIESNNLAGKKTVMILPVGPIGQYPYFVRMVTDRRTSLKNCWFFNMDEYLNEDDTYIDTVSPLSFRGFMDRFLYSLVQAELLPPEEQRIFPDPKNPKAADVLLSQLGGADICFGGIGINGHLAFNEPITTMTHMNFATLPTRTLDISPETRTANAIGDLGGALESMPKRAVTLGMASILASKKIRLGVFRDWHRSVCRRAAYGAITSDFPATLLQQHPDTCIYVNDVAARSPLE